MSHIVTAGAELGPVVLTFSQKAFITGPRGVCVCVCVLCDGIVLLYMIGTYCNCLYHGIYVAIFVTNFVAHLLHQLLLK